MKLYILYMSWASGESGYNVAPHLYRIVQLIRSGFDIDPMMQNIEHGLSANGRFLGELDDGSWYEVYAVDEAEVEVIKRSFIQEEETKTYLFKVELQGTGETEEGAWQDAVECFTADPGSPSHVEEL